MNIVVVEDDDLTRMNLQILLQGEPSIDRVEAFSAAEEAVAAASWGDAHILLTDIDLPGMNGVDLIAWVQVNHETVSCMAYTVFDNRETVFSAIRAGACGYLLKGASPRELIESLLDIYRGGSPMSPPIARKIVRSLQEKPSQAGGHLTKREKEVLRAIEQGLSYKEVAEQLGISAHTVHSHIKNTYEKFQVADRDEVLHKARRLGWI